MQRAIAPDLQAHLRLDGEWLRCSATNCPAYWGAFRSWTWLRAKVADHRARKHAGRALRPPAARPQRRAAAARPQGAHAALLTANGLNRAMVGARLGQGVTREVFEYGPDLVVKFGKPHGMVGDGRVANLVEFRSYQHAPERIRSWLCPVLAVAPDGEWLLMRKAEVHVLSVGQHSAIRDALKGVVDDLHGGNVGLLDGRPVAIDFGFGAVPGENNRVRQLA